jgi:hypothetical protein
LSLRVREAEPGDLAAITRLVGQLGYPSSEPAVAGRLERLAEDPRSWVFVALDGERVVGLASVHLMPILERDDPTARITAMVVDRPPAGAEWGERCSSGWRRRRVPRAAAGST